MYARERTERDGERINVLIIHFMVDPRQPRDSYLEASQGFIQDSFPKLMRCCVPLSTTPQLVSGCGCESAFLWMCGRESACLWMCGVCVCATYTHSHIQTSTDSERVDVRVFKCAAECACVCVQESEIEGERGYTYV